MRRMNKRFIGFMMTASMMVLAACGNTDAAEEGTSGTETASSSKTSSDTLYVGVTNPMGNLSPINASGVSTRWVQRYYFDTLLEMTSPLEFEPKLADSFETTDNQTYTVKLNPNATWTDGTPITADDVVFSLNLFANPEVQTTGLYLTALEGVNNSGKLEEGTEIPNLVAVDEHTVTFKTKTPTDPNYVKEMIGTNIFVQPKHVVEGIPFAELDASDAFTKPSVTSGPYKFVEYVQDSHMELAANEDYYRGAPKVSSVFIRVMSGTNLATELQTGGVTMNASGGIGEIAISDIDMVSGVEGVTLETQPSWTAQYMYINTTSYDENIRLAMSHAVNRDTIVDNLLQGNADVIASPYSAASPYYNDDLSPLAYDPEKAKDYIAKSEYNMSEPIELMVPTGNKVREQSANLIEQDLEAVGFTVEQVTYDFPTTLEKARAADFDLYLGGIAVPVDPDLASYFGSEGGSNYAHIQDAEIDAMLEAGKSETDSAKRKEIYDAFQVMLQEKAPIVPLYSQHDIVIKQDNLTGGIKEYWGGSLYDVHEWTLD
ncbi:ABC transporter substrate-binding protein [Jeotgalibaca sp. A127]|uniref:ABC transporter substrate-binding protein n=1 Tax=Jeotgalibaca sp. A127 TaxID=3457324 RepID=UPI003FCF8074